MNTQPVSGHSIAPAKPLTVETCNGACPECGHKPYNNLHCIKCGHNETAPDLRRAEPPAKPDIDYLNARALASLARLVK